MATRKNSRNGYSRLSNRDLNNLVLGFLLSTVLFGGLLIYTRLSPEDVVTANVYSCSYHIGQPENALFRGVFCSEGDFNPCFFGTNSTKIAVMRVSKDEINRVNDVNSDYNTSIEW